ncbi:cytochrome c maturation protein CcmE [Rhodocaloribacter litoris]|uniref:cytochrome c maturation protein CcmE domain-containing protein n=1 Tax=Rhodocaloribacter litoris TaxID=2558931 RepID=UPI001420FBAF|nr:cytochrome c maturation protein CcmE [Rhodocaloribacter litoris]QXD14148.1 cytochrome c maturation protein CcmE [Rhodocaloribacter litoris]
MNKKTIIGLVLLIGFTSVLFLNFGQQVGGYMDFARAAETGSKAHVVGQWVKEQPATYDPAANVFSFYMRDELGNVRQVRYANPKPANFEDAERLVIDGYAQGDVFVAENILVKCPSKYNDARGLQTTVE